MWADNKTATETQLKKSIFGLMEKFDNSFPKGFTTTLIRVYFIHILCKSADEKCYFEGVLPDKKVRFCLGHFGRP